MHARLLQRVIGVRRLGRIPLPVAVLVFALCACVFLVGLDAWRTVQSREDAIDLAYSETTNLARSLAQHAHDTVKFADILLAEMRYDLETDGWTPEEIALLQGESQVDIGNLPRLHGLFIFDATGKWVVNSLETRASGLRAANDAFFKYHQSHADRGIRIGELLPCVAASDCTFVIPVSRRIDAPDGSFAGVVLATVAVDAMKRFYGTFDIGAQGLIGVTQTNGRIILRAAATEVAPGTDTSRGLVFQTLLAHSPVGVFREASPVDGITRLGSYRQVDEYPLVVIVARSVDEVLAAWSRDASLHLGISIGVAAAIGFLGVRLAHQIKHGQEAERRYRLLADNSSDAIMCIGLDGRRLYVSPAYVALTGRTVEESVGSEVGSAIHPDDRELVQQSMRTLREQRDAEVTLEFRYLREDGTVPWIEARARFVAAEKGQPPQLIANLRDITERKAAENRIVALNRELEKRAITDGLTGLFNRRRFDEALAEEWARAARGAQPLSLLMIDVDCFKAYNDHYGHQHGDDALRMVASTVSGLCRRPGDLAARYGGEEMVMLFPAADAGGAAGRAEAVRAAIEALNVEHAGNPLHPFLTVSVGVATLLPGLDALAGGPEALIAAADGALYGAKRGGRNRVVCAGPTCRDLTRLLDAPAMGMS